MAIIIEQKPLYDTFPVGQEVIFTVSNVNIVTTKTRVKFIAKVYISDSPIVTSTGTALIGNFKTTPNAAGRGMFDLSSIIESYVGSDNLCNIASSYKGANIGGKNPTPLHIVDKYSRNKNIIKYLAVVFRTEYLNTSTSTVVLDNSFQVTENMKIWNGYLKETDAINTIDADFGLNPERFY